MRSVRLLQQWDIRHIFEWSKRLRGNRNSATAPRTGYLYAVAPLGAGSAPT
jgi:hypothetical protein